MPRLQCAATLLIVLLVVGTVGASESPGVPAHAELPRDYVDTSFTPPTSRIIRVSPGGDLQGALNAAQLGDVIELAAGATYIGPFLLPKKEGTGWILLRTSSPDPNFQQNVTRRVNPSLAPLMSRLIASKGTVILLAPGAHHYRFVGVEISPSPATFLNSLVGPAVDPRSDADQPHHLVIDRCYLHGDPALGTRRAIALNGKHIAIIHSHLSDFKEAGADSQALAGWNGSGPFKIVDNYLEGAAENIIFGGGDPQIAGLVPADIEIRGNTFAKNIRWNPRHSSYDGSRWTMKNLFELKNARRVLLEANVFEDYNGSTIVITPRNQSGGAPWSTVEDVTIRHNWIRRVRAVITISGYDEYHPSAPTKRITMEHNIAESLNDTGEPNPKMILINQGPDDVTIRHNTVLTPPGLGSSYLIFANAINKKGNAFAFTDNIAHLGTYGVIGDNPPLGGSSTTLLEGHFRTWIFTRNVLIGIQGIPTSRYPPGQHWESLLSGIGFRNVARGDFRLTAQSRYKGTAINGNDPGANMDALSAAFSRFMSVPSPLKETNR